MNQVIHNHIGVQQNNQSQEPHGCFYIMNDESIHANYHSQTDQSTLQLKVSGDSIFDKENEIIQLIKAHPDIKKLSLILNKGTITIYQAKLIGERLQQVKNLMEVNILFH